MPRKSTKQPVESSEYRELRITNYPQFVIQTCKRGDVIMGELTPRQCHMIHMVLGISGEAGELVDAVKKNAIYRRDLDEKNVIEELGDLEWYMEGLRQALDVTREEVLQRNIEKLSKRYNQGLYNDKSAIGRADKSNEDDND